MSARENSYAGWVSERTEMETWCETVDAALPPFERTLPREPGEAKFLRSIGTPEELIGPEQKPGDESSQAGFWQRMGRRVSSTS
jgi:hypothetical protein